MPRTTPPEDVGELARSLWQHRRNAHLSIEETARQTGIGAGTLSRYEHGEYVPPRDRITALLNLYRVPLPEYRRLHDIARDLKSESKRVVFHRAAAQFQRRIERIEAASGHVATFHPTVVPGLLQTERYMRVLAGSGLAGDKLEEWLAARRSRQAHLGEAGRRYTQILTEGALLWCAGSPEVMVEQAEHIADRVGTRGVRLGIIPARTPAGVFPLHGFDIYDQATVIVGTTAATAILTDPRDVKAHRGLLAKLEPLAVYGDEARTVLRRVADQYRNDL